MEKHLSETELQAIDEMFLEIADPVAVLARFLEQLITGNNVLNDSTFWYQSETIKGIYENILKETLHKYERLPAMSEIIDGVFDFNNDILWKIVHYDIRYGFGDYGYAYLHGAHSGAYVSELLDCWSSSLAFDIGYNLNAHIAQMLSVNNLSYYENVDLRYITRDTVGLTIIINDCQNIMFPEWHYESIAKWHHDRDDNIMRMQFIDEEINYERERGWI